MNQHLEASRATRWTQLEPDGKMWEWVTKHRRL